MNRLKDSLVPIIVFVAMVVAAAGVQQNEWLPTSLVHADSSQNVSGYAWSSNIGWISFNCSNDNTCGTANYGVNIDGSGNVSGYAWSSSIGWISFNELSGCPEAGCTTRPYFDRLSGSMTGWARACKGTMNGDCTGASRTDGWDGWIKLAGTTYGPILSHITFTGYSWGSDVAGWIAWSGTGYGVISPANINCTSSLSVAPDTIEQGQNVLFTWSVSGGAACATSCSGSGFDTGGATSGTDVPASVPPTPPSTSYALTCTGGTYGTPAAVNVTVTVHSPDVEITANGQSTAVRVDPSTANNVTVAWSSTYSTSCAVTKNGAAWRTGLSSSGIIDTVVGQTVYTLDCQNDYGTGATDSVVVNILPVFQEF